jgi:hypothetical protein
MPGMSVSLVMSVGLGWLLMTAPARSASLVPCAPDSPDWSAAKEALTAFDARMEALPEDGDVGVVRSGLKALLGNRCFDIAREEEHRAPLSWHLGEEEGEAVSALALKTWWRDGGKAYLTAWLELGRPGSRTVVIAPDLRDTLSREVSPKHPLGPLLCPTKAEACGAETEGWRVRAEKAFASEERHARMFSDEKPPRVDCMAVARKRPTRLRYKTWRDCQMSNARPVRYVLPLGRIHAPMDGWLVVRGRRGHYGFCDRVDAYHLGTGTAYRSSSCSNLALRSGGEVDTAGTDAARQSEVKVGHIAPERLRELTWMLLLAPEVRQGVQVEALQVPVPKELRVEWPTRLGATEEGVMGGVFGGSTAQTRLRWSWFPSGGGEPLLGEFTYPWSYAPGEDHANGLLKEAEGSFQEGCPKLPLPTGVLDFTREPTVSAVDAPEGVKRVQDARVEALFGWKPPTSCAQDLRDGG